MPKDYFYCVNIVSVYLIDVRAEFQIKFVVQKWSEHERGQSVLLVFIVLFHNNVTIAQHGSTISIVSDHKYIALLWRYGYIWNMYSTC